MIGWARCICWHLLRVLRWEFWPLWAFYAPVALYCLLLILRYRGLACGAANPGLVGGELTDRDKYARLDVLQNACPNLVAPSLLIPASMPQDQRQDMAANFAERNGYPLVLKPNNGCRGRGVRILHTPAALHGELTDDQDMVMQSHIPGPELGVFYIRYPGWSEGRIFSITEKRLPHLTGDGKSTLEQLVFADSRARYRAIHLRRRWHHKWHRVLHHGERLQLTEVGSHCLGALFVNGRRHYSPALHRNIERLAGSLNGFYFGRFDIKCPNGLAQAHDFQVLELNGLFSEAAHIYDPEGSLWSAWGTLMRQWRHAFAIGHNNSRRGAQVPTWKQLMQDIRS